MLRNASRQDLAPKRRLAAVAGPWRLVHLSWTFASAPAFSRLLMISQSLPRPAAICRGVFAYKARQPHRPRLCKALSTGEL